MASEIISKSPTINKLKELGISLKSLPSFRSNFLKAKIADELGCTAVALSCKAEAVKALIMMHEFEKADRQAGAYGLTLPQMNEIAVAAAADRLLISDLDSAKKILGHYGKGGWVLEILVCGAAAALRGKNREWNAWNLEYMAGMRKDAPPSDWNGPRTY